MSTVISGAISKPRGARRRASERVRLALGVGGPDYNGHSLPHRASKTLSASLSFLNRRNMPGPAPRRILTADVSGATPTDST
jgi:hypothetical protein